MIEIEKNKLDAFFKTNSDLIRIEEDGFIEAVALGNFIYLSCHIKTFGKLDYTVIYDSYEGGHIKEKSEALKDEYLSDFNKSIGAGLVIIRKVDMSIHKLYYFKDNYNLYSKATFVGCTDNNQVVISPDEYCYVFKNGVYEHLHFVNSYKYKRLGDYWILYPTIGYDAICSWELIDFREKRVFSIPFFYYPKEEETVDIYFNLRKGCICFDYGDCVEIPFKEVYRVK